MHIHNAAGLGLVENQALAHGPAIPFDAPNDASSFVVPDLLLPLETPTAPCSMASLRPLECGWRQSDILQQIRG